MKWYKQHSKSISTGREDWIFFEPNNKVLSYNSTEIVIPKGME